MRSSRVARRAATVEHQCDNSPSTSELRVALASEELFRDDSALLLSAASQLLCDDSTSSCSFTARPPVADFPSFQALLQAAASVAPDDDIEALPAKEKVPGASSRTQKRREQNRISCRKTRLKRKVEQASEDVLASKRAEHNRFLVELHQQITQLNDEQHGSQSLESARLARQLVVRSVHFQLMDPEYDASWCFESSNRQIRGKKSGAAVNQELLEQWRSIVAELENASLDILQIRDIQESATQEVAGSQSQQLCCQWRIAGFSKQQPQSGRVEETVISGATRVRFTGRSIEAIDMRVTPSCDW